MSNFPLEDHANPEFEKFRAKNVIDETEQKDQERQTMLSFANIMKSIRMSVSPENEAKEIDRISRQLIASRGDGISQNLRKITRQLTGQGGIADKGKEYVSKSDWWSGE